MRGLYHAAPWTRACLGGGMLRGYIITPYSLSFCTKIEIVILWNRIYGTRCLPQVMATHGSCCVVSVRAAALSQLEASVGYLY